MGQTELARLVWTLSIGDNNPWRCLMAARFGFASTYGHGADEGDGAGS